MRRRIAIHLLSALALSAGPTAAQPAGTSPANTSPPTAESPVAKSGPTSGTTTGDPATAEKPAGTDKIPVKTVEECVSIGLLQSAKIGEAEAKVEQYKARLAEVQANYGWQLNTTAWLAPMFTVEGNAIDGAERRFGPTDWGPYAHLDALLVKPFYTFGRVEAGERAARSRMEVERARVAAAENVVALEIRRLYYATLYARSMLPSLRFGGRLIDSALKQAEEMYADADASVTQVDLMKLQYGQAEVRRFRRLAEDGARLGLSALKQAMGLGVGHNFDLAEEKLTAPEGDDPSLAQWIAWSSQHRPEWAMLRHGKQAALSLTQAERFANRPALFVAGQLQADWAPTRDDADNPYHFDPYNQIFGGVAVGIRWDFHPSKTEAKVAQAKALAQEVEALKGFAQTGIPLQVTAAYSALTQKKEIAKEAKSSVKSTRKWMTFAAAAYSSGTGEARDVLEGLVAYLTAKRTHYESLRDYHQARADLLYAAGVRQHPNLTRKTADE